MDVLTIGGVGIGGDNPCRFVAEIGANHNGSLATAHRLIEAAHHTGAEFVKLQAYTLPEILGLRGDGPAPEPWARFGTLRQLYERAITPLAWLPELFQHARDIGMVPFASVFGLESLAALEALDCPAYKIAAYDVSTESLRRAIAIAAGRQLVVSTPGVDPFGHYGDGVCVLYCPPGYPTMAQNVALPLFAELDHELDQPAAHIGLSSHCLDPFLPIAAVARGCKLIEMHLQHVDKPAELDGSFSLTADQFGQMVQSVRQTERLLA